VPFYRFNEAIDDKIEKLIKGRELADLQESIRMKVEALEKEKRVALLIR
jgi:hypothetical protein